MSTPIEISKVREINRIQAQQRAITQHIKAFALSKNQFRVNSFKALYDAMDYRAELNIDYYKVRTFESDGHLFATCSCAFGQKAEDDNLNVCKHIEAALVAREKIVKPKAKPIPMLPSSPSFDSATITIKIGRNEFTMDAIARDSSGGFMGVPLPRRKRFVSGMGFEVLNRLFNVIDKEF